MPFMLCRNRVVDFARWHGVFVSHEAAHRRAGLHLVGIWPRIEDRNELYFLFRVESLDRARAFIADPDAAQAGTAAGVLEGEYHFLADGEGCSREPAGVS